MLHSPNEITKADFDGWVQERGLYFADRWDSRYLSVLESHDKGEEPLFGGELYTKYGKGAYIFTAYDWFRELPFRRSGRLPPVRQYAKCRKNPAMIRR